MSFFVSIFRCVAPIINFSAQFYSNRLIPLRVARPSERFDPPLVDVFIDHPERRGKTNPVEAAWIVDEVANLVCDPVHEARDIGVVSLIGGEQARLIETRLLEDPRIGPEVIKIRRIVCGDARSMQGQERSVMFLSMVATPDSVISQTTKDIQQRLNVAMSRAKDRVYLIRSVRAAHLKPQDLKLKVLKHFQDPMPEGAKIAGAELMDRCDSGFERDVLGRLLDAGYRATPQVSAGAYRIDIVVEGVEDRRLAIELDGDAYHGPERWVDDMVRQAALERAGWVFWRVFGSQWESEKEHWWCDLLKTLSGMGIEPIGSMPVNDGFVELRLAGGFEASPHAGEAIPEKKAATIVDSPSAPEPRVAQSPPLASENKDLVPLTLPFAENVSEEIGAVAVRDLFSPHEPETEEVGVGAFVRLEKDDGETMDVVIVADRPAPEQGRIAVSSPLGEALLGALKGEEVEFAVGDSVKCVRVLEVRRSEAA